MRIVEEIGALSRVSFGHAVELNKAERNLLEQTRRLVEKIRDELRETIGEDDAEQFDTSMASVEHGIANLLTDPRIRG